MELKGLRNLPEDASHQPIVGPIHAQRHGACAKEGQQQMGWFERTETDSEWKSLGSQGGILIAAAKSSRGLYT
jgi:hypothetical protein